MESNNDILILAIETSCDVCSVALSRNGVNTDSEMVTEVRMQTTRLAPMVDNLLSRNHIGVKDCSAVAVSSGPGSYTGLRVGVSLAKGLCFGAGIPLIGVGTLDLLAAQGAEAGPAADYIVPMIDARRMEVYQAVYDGNLGRATDIEPKILDGDSYREWLEKGNVLFCGNGCSKFRDILDNPSAGFAPFNPDARYMAPLAYDLFCAGKFVDVAYFEPFYLKDFTISINKKKILG